MEEGGCTRSSHNPSFARAEGTGYKEISRGGSAIINGISVAILGVQSDGSYVRSYEAEVGKISRKKYYF